MGQLLMGNFANERHALYVGWVMGLAIKHGVHLEPEIDDDGNYTDRLIVPLPESEAANGIESITLVVPEPSEHWVLA